ncbi:DUF6292 family protein [Nocardiopsis halophila]|uniref:DUF6292 family protein n=1 Tax=Nocardiopsis halophila TaxID=141692 RepID=UPI000345204A|nr:DUF6292 family protein [Nocardiopsis halophila]
MIDTALPHAPYIAAVAEGLGLRPADVSYDHEDGDGRLVMEAVFTAPDGYVLAWRQTTGWKHGASVYPEECWSLTSAVVPAPADVAAAWAALGRTPYACAETEPAGGPLPGVLAEAVAAGDVDGAMAARLAAYCAAA